MKRSSVRVLMLIVCCAWLSAPAVALACTVTPADAKRTAADRTKAATIVLEGVVLSGEKNRSTYLSRATVEVKQYLKGNGPTTITIESFNPCFSSVNVGDHLIFYIGVESDQTLYSYDEEPVTPAVLDEIRAAAGQAPPAQDQPAAGQAPPAAQLPSRLPETSAPVSGPGRSIWLLGFGCLALGLILARTLTSRPQL